LSEMKIYRGGLGLIFALMWGKCSRCNVCIWPAACRFHFL